MADEAPFDVVWENRLIKGADAIQVLDFDGDGSYEIYVVSYSSKDTILSCFDVSGSLLWDQAIPEFSVHAYPTEEVKFVYVGDVDSDEYLDLVIGSEAVAPALSYHPLYLAERLPEKGIGFMVMENRWTYDKSDLTTSARIVDLYGENENFVITTSNDFNIYVFSQEGALAEKYTAEGSLWDIHAVNADNDQQIELVAGSFQSIVYFKDNDVEWVYPTENRISKVFASDLDSDGVPELLGASRFNLYALNTASQLLWKRKIDDLTSNFIVEDLEGDGTPEVIVGSGGVLSVYNSIGALLFQMNLEGRINSIGVVNADDDNLIEVVVGLNNRIILLKLREKYAKSNMALKHHESALQYFSDGFAEKAITELHESIRLYEEIEDTKAVSELTKLLSEYEKTLILEDRISLALDYLNKSRRYYGEGLLENSSQYAIHARDLFEKLNNTYGILEAEAVIQQVEDHLMADDLISEAEGLYIQSSFEDALVKARKAHALYIKVDDSFGIKKSLSVIVLSEEASRTSTTYKTTIPLTTVRKTTTINASQDLDKNNLLLYAGFALLAVLLAHTIRTTIKVRRKKRAI
ncbi:MAG: hypothetical protein ABH851_02710 [Methanobacteriota archaeon]